ncbi:hypothetical protein [Halorubrum sp. F4]|uniref:hypothetical protein n=1 Tax=Halorubrum sp. F4 TaxID=2989715 RepID=UPI0024804D5B|nr:hypothetical protein [Halorubrum sp. F4]
MNRRGVLAAGMLAVGGAMAASARVVAESLAESSGSATPVVDPDLRTVRALPEPDDGWERSRPTALAIDGTAAEEGTGAEYVAPDGESALVHVVLWPDAGVAAERAETDYAEWDRAITHEELTFACDGPSRADVTELLSASPELDGSAADSDTDGPVGDGS